LKRPSGGPDGHAETHTRVGQLFESLQPGRELLPKGPPYDSGRNVKLTDENLAV
jgi:hypothetical protein